jgi:hypothetical protein
MNCNSLHAHYVSGQKLTFKLQNAGLEYQVEYQTLSIYQGQILLDKVSYSVL